MIRPMAAPRVTTSGAWAPSGTVIVSGRGDEADEFLAPALECDLTLADFHQLLDHRVFRRRHILRGDDDGMERLGVELFFVLGHNHSIERRPEALRVSKPPLRSAIVGLHHNVPSP